MRTLHPKTCRWIAPLCALFLSLACTPWQAHALTFNDVNVTTPHQEDIIWLAENGISTGYPGGLFKPMTDVYRQDMAAFLYRLAGEPDYTPTSADKARFKDVNDQTPHAKEIYWLAASGISTGYLDGTFKPLAPVVRQDMAAFLRRLAKVMGDPESESWKPQNTNAFPDVTAQTDHQVDILWLAETEISAGYPDKTFRPLVKVARQDMAAFLHRLNDHVAEHELTKPTESTWNGCRIIKAPAECGCEIGQIIGYADNGQKITYDSPGVYIASVPASLQKLTLPESIDGLPVVSVTLEESDSGTASSLTTIDARAAKQLELIWTKTSRLSTVLIDNLTMLETVILEKCPLSEINLNGCERLSTLILNATKVSSLDLTHCPNLMTLSCTFSQLTELDITPCKRLQDLNCGGNYISDTSKLEAWLKMPNHTGQVGQQASIHKNARLESSSGYTYVVVDKDSGITWGNVVAKATNGAYLYYRGEGVYVLETNESGAVTLPSILNGMPLRAVSLGSAYGDVASIDASKANSLTSLQLVCPNLEAVDVHGLKALDQFSVLESKLSSLDITGCTGLSSLTIRNSNITSLDLSSATKLLFLIVDRNELERLDVSPCKSLTYLDCSFNRIADTSALTTWLAQPGHSGTCLPQNV